MKEGLRNPPEFLLLLPSQSHKSLPEMIQTKESCPISPIIPRSQVLVMGLPICFKAHHSLLPLIKRWRMTVRREIVPISSPSLQLSPTPSLNPSLSLSLGLTLKKGRTAVCSVSPPVQQCSTRHLPPTLRTPRPPLLAYQSPPCLTEQWNCSLPRWEQQWMDSPFSSPRKCSHRY